jgi:hypothetical protein
MAFFAPDESARPPLKGVLIDRMRYAAALGMRLMKVPFYNELELPAAYYAPVPEDFEETFYTVSDSIERQGVGGAYLTDLGLEFGKRAVRTISFGVRRLPRVELTETDKEKVCAAVREAADSDAIAAHIAMGNDLFCTIDRGRSAPGPSILDDTHRSWLERAYEVKFTSPEELAALLAT